MDFRVGSWQVRPDMDTLVGKGEPCHLSPKAMDVLVCLARHQGQVVCKEELVGTVWNGTFVSDDSLTRCVAELRRAFDDDAREPSVIRTIPKRGFTLLPEVTWEPEIGGPSESDIAEVALRDVLPDSSAERTASIAAKWKLPALAILFLTVIALAAVFLYPRFRPSVSPAKPRIAVLPFANTSGDPQQEYLADGMTEQVITEMAHISSWQVISRTSVMRYGGTKLPLPQVAKQLGADNIMEGTIQRSGGRVRITAQLIDARTDVHLWSGSFEKDMSDVLGLQREIAGTIASELRVKLSESESTRLNSATRKVVPAAYDAYLTGRYFHDRGQYDKAAAYFEQAMHLDPNFALAYVFFSEAKGMISFNLDTPPDSFLMQAGKKAMELDPNLADAHFVTGDITFFYNWDWTKGEAEYRRAVELDPNSTGASLHYAIALACLNRLDEAIAELHRGLHIDPVALNLNLSLLNLLIASRQVKEAEAQFQRVIELDSENASAYRFIARLRENQGFSAEAIAANLTADRLLGVSKEQLSARTRAATAGGLKGYWKECAEEYVKNPGQTRVSPFVAATMYARSGEADTAMKLLEQAFQERSQRLPWIQVTLTLDPLRSDPRFQALVKRMNFPK